MDLLFIHSAQISHFGNPSFGPGHYRRNDAVAPTCASCHNNRKKQHSSSKGLTVKVQPIMNSTYVAPQTPTISNTAAEVVKKQQPQKHSGSTAHDTTSGSDGAAAAAAKENQQPQENKDAASVSAAQQEEHVQQARQCSVAILQEEPHNQRPAAASMDPELAQELVNKTTHRVNHNIAKSTFLQQHVHVMDNIPTFRLANDLHSQQQQQQEVDTDDDSNVNDNDNDLMVRGDLCGSGGFAFVYQVELKDPSRIHNNHNYKQYVVKHLSPQLLDANHNKKSNNNNKKLYLGAKDLVVESYMLAALDHPHILKLQGCSPGGIAQFAMTASTDAYFMVLPRLSCTLADKMSMWKRLAAIQQQQQQQHFHLKQKLQRLQDSPTTTTASSTFSHNSSSNSNSSGNSAGGMNWMVRSMDRRRRNREDKDAQQHQEDLLFCERVQINIDLLKALEYLHERRIMHRDVKPPNVGFDQDGCLKLFDFGLAKELPADAAYYTGECKTHSTAASTTGNPATMSPFSYGMAGPLGTNNNPNMYMFLGNTGTPRYMAPEIIRREPYDCKVDVYATSIVCWEIMTLKKPYGANVSGQYVKECVAIYGDRPSPLPRKWPKGLKKLIKQGWTTNLNARPTSKEMRIAMEEILDQQQHKMGLSVDV